MTESYERSVRWALTQPRDRCGHLHDLAYREMVKDGMIDEARGISTRVLCQQFGKDDDTDMQALDAREPELLPSEEVLHYGWLQRLLSHISHVIVQRRESSVELRDEADQYTALRVAQSLMRLEGEIKELESSLPIVSKAVLWGEPYCHLPQYGKTQIPADFGMLDRIDCNIKQRHQLRAKLLHGLKNGKHEGLIRKSEEIQRAADRLTRVRHRFTVSYLC